MPVIRASLLAVFALISCALALDLARAQDPTTETATTLHPGLNLIGWTAEPTPTSQLFREIPQLEAVWAWDAELDDWIIAARGAPEWLGGLGRVTPGMGLRMQISGNEPFVWQRSTEPTRGLVELRTGWNLVAWSGANETPIDDALKGIGWSLRAVHRWNPATQQWSTWTSPERTAQLIAADNADQETNDNSETPTIRRGEALWINVARAVNWLQPTDILPRLIFPGGASGELQTRVRQDLEATLAFFRTQYGIQADPDFTVYIPTDVELLIQAYRDGGEDVGDEHEASTRGLWERDAPGWARGEIIVVRQSFWSDDLSSGESYGGRYLLTHEYFHILQGQLSGEIVGESGATWLIEGAASWAGNEHAVFDGELTQDELRNPLLAGITNAAPTLRSTERGGNAKWEYSLGRLAIDRLTTDSGPDFPIEFWRSLASTETGPHGRWTSTLDWRTALRRLSGQTASEFYAAFDAWQREQATANAASTGSYEYDGSWIHGRVTGEGGAPVAGLFVNAIRPESETNVGRHRRAKTAADGSFAVWVPENGDYRLSVDINENCTRYYSNGQLINDGRQWDDLRQASPIEVSEHDVSGINFQLSQNVCRQQIRGRVVGSNNEPLEGLGILACRPQMCYTGYAIGALVLDGPPPGVSFAAQYVATASDGSFIVTPGLLGVYLRLILDDTCSVWYTPAGLSFDQNVAAAIAVDGSGSKEVSIQVPSWICRWQIGGYIVGADGQPFADTYVSACLEIDGDCASRLGASTDDSGTLAITVPAEGNYRLWIDLDGCTLYFAGDGLTTTHSERAVVRVERSDVRLGHRQIPADMCAHRISGRFVDSNSAPVASKWMNVCGPGACNGIWTGTDGQFTIRVPHDDAYTVRVWLADGCTHRLRGSSFGSPDNPIRVSGADITGITLSLPGTVEELCE